MVRRTKNGALSAALCEINSSVTTIYHTSEIVGLPGQWDARRWGIHCALLAGGQRVWACLSHRSLVAVFRFRFGADPDRNHAGTYASFYLHLPATMGIAAAGAATLNVLEHAGEPTASP